MSKHMMDNLHSADTDLQREGAFQAAEALAEEAVPMLVALLHSPNLGVQEAADHALRKIGGRKAVEGVLPLLRDDDAPVRNLGMDLLRALGNQHLELLLPYLKDEDPDIRIFMADILGATDDVAAVQPLCSALLHDPEVNVRYQAAVSLGELARQEAAKSLNQALDDDEWVKFAVIEALMKIRDDSSINAFVRALDRSSELVASMIIDALGEMGNIKAVPMLLKRLDSSPTALRNKILRAIVGIMGSRTLSLLSADEQEKFRMYLLVALEDEETEIQDAAIAGLGYVGDAQATARILALTAQLDVDHDLERVSNAVSALVGIGINAALSDGLQSEAEGTLLVAISVLEKIATPEAVGLLIGAFADRSRDIQRSLCTSIGRIGGLEARDFFLDVLESSKDGTILKQALLFLGSKIRCTDCLDAILVHLRHPYDDVKEAALEAAIGIGGESATVRFREMTSSTDAMERLMGVYGLGQMDPAGNREALVAALSDESPDVRKIALDALGSLAGNDERVLVALLHMARDEVAEVRLALVDVMSRVCGPEARSFLVEALRDDEDWVRIRAMEALVECRAGEHIQPIVEMLEDTNQLVVIKAIAALGRMGGQVAFKALLSQVNSEDPEIQAAAEAALDSLHSADSEVL